MKKNIQMSWWKSTPKHPFRTIEEWEEFKRPLIFVNGCGAEDIYITEDDRVMAKWRDGPDTLVKDGDQIVIIQGRDSQDFNWRTPPAESEAERPRNPN